MCIWSLICRRQQSRNSSTLLASESFNNHTEAVEVRAERSPSSCFYSLSQDLIAIQLTTRHTGAVLIASNHNEWVTAYGGKSGEWWDDGKPSVLQVLSFVTETPFRMCGHSCNGFSGCEHVRLVMGLASASEAVSVSQHTFNIASHRQEISSHTSVSAQL